MSESSQIYNALCRILLEELVLLDGPYIQVFCYFIE